MSDELAELKQRATERRERLGDGTGIIEVTLGDITMRWRGAERDLDRALAIAEGHYENYLMWHARHGDRMKERDQARAYVVALRDALDTYKDTEVEYPEVVKVLAATEHYEQWR